MNNCKTINDYRLLILERCQDCEMLVYCMYDICISRIAQPDYISVSVSLDCLEVY